jgi:hypothetical protein
MVVAGAAPVVRAQMPPAPEVTDEHKMLKKDVGVWDAEMKIWAAGPDTEPMVTKGIERNRMLGGLWLLSNFSADMGGQEYKGFGQFGYDAKQKKYVGTWVDSMTTSISEMQGTYDKDKNEMVMYATGVDPETGKEVKSKSVSKHMKDGRRLFTMYMHSPDGEEQWVKSMEITYTRQPGQRKKKAR